MEREIRIETEMDVRRPLLEICARPLNGFFWLTTDAAQVLPFFLRQMDASRRICKWRTGWLVVDGPTGEAGRDALVVRRVRLSRVRPIRTTARRCTVCFGVAAPIRRTAAKGAKLPCPRPRNVRLPPFGG